MALVRNIAGIDEPTNTTRLLQAFRSAQNSVPVDDTPPIPVTQVQTSFPRSGGNVDGAPRTSAYVPNIATIKMQNGMPVINNESNMAVGAVGTTLTSLLVPAGLGLAAYYLLTKQGVIGKKKKSLLVPVAIVGGVAALWYFSKGSGAATQADKERDWLLNTFHATNEQNQQAMLAAIPQMNDTELHYLYLRAASQLPGGPALTADDRVSIDALFAKYNIQGL